MMVLVVLLILYICLAFYLAIEVVDLKHKTKYEPCEVCNPVIKECPPLICECEPQSARMTIRTGV